MTLKDIKRYEDKAILYSFKSDNYSGKIAEFFQKKISWGKVVPNMTAEGLYITIERVCDSSYKEEIRSFGAEELYNLYGEKNNIDERDIFIY